MRNLAAAISVGLLGICGPMQSADAGLLGHPINLRSALEHIKLDVPTLSPMAYTKFCIQYENECRVSRSFRGGPIRLTAAHWGDLKLINSRVNQNILPERNELGLAGESWLISPAKGDCNDYAVTKRHELLKRGWPRRALLLSEVVTASGEHHLVVVVRAKGGDLVLDNMTSQIKRWSTVPYRWVRIQKPYDARLWATIAEQKV